MKKFILILVALASFSAIAEIPHDEVVRVIARIQSQGDGIKVVRSIEKDVIPSLLQEAGLNDVINALGPGDEAVIEGKISYHATNYEGQTKYIPVFIITSIKPISLKRLAQMDQSDLDKHLGPTYSNIDYFKYTKASFPVSTQVASALTLTTTALLMNSLTSGPTTLETKKDLNAGMFMFAGVLATGVFIFEQITNK